MHLSVKGYETLIRLLLAALDNHIKSLKKQLDEKQVVIETLIKIYKNFLTTTLLLQATLNLIKFFVKYRLSSGRKKEINSNDKSVQMHDDNSNNSGINSQEAIRESKENQFEALRNSVNNSNGKEIKEQPNESLRHHPDNIDGVKSTGKEKKKTVTIVDDSVIKNIPCCSLNNSLDECFGIIKSFPGATTKDMRYYIKPSMARKPDMIVLHTGTKNSKNDSTPSDIASETIQLAKSIRTNRI